MRKGIPNQAYANTSKVEEVRMREKEEEIRGKHSRPIQLNRTTQTNLNGKREKNEKRKKNKAQTHTFQPKTLTKFIYLFVKITS
jgi:hypothetical protein